MADINIVVHYIPADCGSAIPGKSKAPKAFQDVGITQKLAQNSLKVLSEHSPLPEPAKWQPIAFTPGSVRNEDLNIQVCQLTQKSISSSLPPHPTPQPFQLILGGECCMLPGILSALTHHAPSRRIGLIYIDADVDLSDPQSSSTGNFASMTMTHLLSTPGALSAMNPFSHPDGTPLCDSQNTVFFGTNMSSASNTRGDMAYLFDNNFRVFPSSAITADPTGCAYEALVYLLDNKVDDILVHLDVDSIDPTLFPLANIPNYTGVPFETMMSALKPILGNPKVMGLSVAEVNPDHDPELEMTARLADEIVEGLSARIHSSNSSGTTAFNSSTTAINATEATPLTPSQTPPKPQTPGPIPEPTPKNLSNIINPSATTPQPPTRLPSRSTRHDVIVPPSSRQQFRHAQSRNYQDKADYH